MIQEKAKNMVFCCGKHQKLISVNSSIRSKGRDRSDIENKVKGLLHLIFGFGFAQYLLTGKFTFQIYNILVNDVGAYLRVISLDWSVYSLQIVFVLETGG